MDCDYLYGWIKKKDTNISQKIVNPKNLAGKAEELKWLNILSNFIMVCWELCKKKTCFKFCWIVAFHHATERGKKTCQ